MLNYKNNLAELLFNSEIFEVYFLGNKLTQEKYIFQSDYIDFRANTVEKIVSKEIKEELIFSFLEDVEKGGEISRCWIPHHGIKAICKGQQIEIAICYMCGQFRGQINETKLHGTFPNEEESKSFAIFSQIINE